MKHLIKAVSKNVYDWYICLGENPALHKAKIEFFAMCKPYSLDVKGVLWEIAKQMYPSSLAVEKMEDVVQRVVYKSADVCPYLFHPKPKQHHY